MPGAAHVVAEYKDLLSRTEDLIRQFHSSLSAGTVITTVTHCRDELMRTGLRRGLSTATESMARARLQQLLLTRGGSQAGDGPSARGGISRAMTHE